MDRPWGRELTAPSFSIGDFPPARWHILSAGLFPLGLWDEWGWEQVRLVMTPAQSLGLLSPPPVPWEPPWATCVGRDHRPRVCPEHPVLWNLIIYIVEKWSSPSRRLLCLWQPGPLWRSSRCSLSVWALGAEVGEDSGVGLPGATGPLTAFLWACRW